MHTNEPSKTALHNWRATAALLVFSAAFGGLLLFGLAASDEGDVTASCDTGCPAVAPAEAVSITPTSCSEIHSHLRGRQRVEPSMNWCVGAMGAWKYEQYLITK